MGLDPGRFPPRRKNSVSAPRLSDVKNGWGTSKMNWNLFAHSKSTVVRKTEHLRRRLDRNAKFKPKIVLDGSRFPVEEVGGKKTIGRVTATFMIINQLLSGGIEMLPIGYLQMGWLPMLCANFACFALATVASLMTAKSMTMISGNQLFKQRYEYVATVRHFLGDATATAIEIAFHVLALHSLLSFNDLVHAFDALILQPLTGLRVVFSFKRWTPRINTTPLLADGYKSTLAQRFAIPPWVSNLTLSERGLEQPERFPAVTMSLGYILLGVMLSIVCRRNLEDDQWLQQMAFGATAAGWAVLVLLCARRLPIVEATKHAITCFLDYVERSEPKSVFASVMAIPKSLLAGRLRRMQAGTKYIARFCEGLLGSPRMPNWKSLSMSTVVPVLTFQSSFTVEERELRIRRVETLLDTPGVTAVQLNYLSLEADFGSDYSPVIRSLTDQFAFGHTCGTCYTDICFDALLASDILVCPDPAWAARIRDIRIQEYISQRYYNETFRPSRWPSTLKGITKTFMLLSIYVRLWSITDIVPSLVNEVKEDVNITETFWMSTIIAGTLVSTISFVVATSFPGLSSLDGTSPIALIVSSYLPQYAANILLFCFAFFTISPRWKLGTTCTSLWAFVLYKWEPSSIVFDPKLLTYLRYAKERWGGRSDIFFSERARFGSFLARTLRTLKSITYKKSYVAPDSWRVLKIYISSIKDEGQNQPSTEDTDAHLSLADLALALLASHLSLENLDLCANCDPGAPEDHWNGLPPIRNCEWYILCPKNFPPCSETMQLESPTGAGEKYDPRVAYRQKCTRSVMSKNDKLLITAASLETDTNDHLICCSEMERLAYYTGRSLARPLVGKPPAEGVLHTDIPSKRPTLSFPKLKSLSLRPPYGDPYSPNCWALLCLFRALQFVDFPELQELRILGSFVVQRQLGGENPEAKQGLEQQPASRFQGPFENTDLWARDMMNLFLFGDIPVRSQPNFLARRFFNFSTQRAYHDQQTYWREIVEKSTVWSAKSFPKLEKLTISAASSEAAGKWTRLLLRNCFAPKCSIHTLELERVIKSPVDAFRLPFDDSTMNNERFPNLRRVIVKGVYGTDCLTTVQRIFSIYLEKPIVAQTTELVLTDHSDFGVEAARVTKWTDYQAKRRLEPSHLDDTEVSSGPFSSAWLLKSSSKPLIALEDTFFVKQRPKKLKLRLLTDCEKADPDVIEERIINMLSSKAKNGKSIPSKVLSYLISIGDGRGSLEEYDIYPSGEPNTVPVIFSDIDELEIDVGTYTLESKDPQLFDNITERVMSVWVGFAGSSWEKWKRQFPSLFPDLPEDSSSGESEPRELPKKMSVDSADEVSAQLALRAKHRAELLLEKLVAKDLPDTGRVGGSNLVHFYRSTESLVADTSSSWEHSVLGQPEYRKNPPRPAPTSTKRIRIVLRYAMSLADKMAPNFGTATEADRRVNIARKWLVFNPTLAGVPSSEIEVRIARKKRHKGAST